MYILYVCPYCHLGNWTFYPFVSSPLDVSTQDISPLDILNVPNYSVKTQATLFGRF